MTNQEFGIIAGAVLVVGMWALATEIRLVRMHNKLLKLQNDENDSGIQDRIHALSNIDLDARLREELGSGPKPSA